METVKTNPVKPYAESSKGKKEQVAEMFDSIAPKYDFLNRLLSGGIDIWWRRTSINKLKAFKPKTILDVATGTGDLALDAFKLLKPNSIVGVDISEGMLAFGKEKVKKLGLDSKISFEVGDSEKLRFESNSFDATIVSFGVRNFENLEVGLKELNRVTKPQGHLMVLEFSQPTLFPIKQLYWFYARFVLPLIGKWVSNDASAYTYLPNSVKVFPSGANFVAILKASGFAQVSHYPLTFGIATAYIAKK